jgi:hypothetical protein
MRVFAPLCLAGLFAGAGLRQAPPPPAPAGAAAAAKVLAAAREALGGDSRLSSVRNFVATGRTRQVRGDNLVPIEFEIACELPHKYVRTDEIPAQESGPTTTGFNGDDLIQLPPPAGPMPGRDGAPGRGPSPDQLEAMRRGRVAAIKQDFVRLTLGLFAGSFDTYPLTFSYVGQAEAPQGKADVIDAKGAGNFAVRLFINSETHLPIMVSWQGPGMPMRGMPGRGPAGPPMGPGSAPPAPGTPTSPPTAAPSGPGAATAPAPPAAGGPPPGAGVAAAAGRTGAPGIAPPGVEYRIYYADYRDVDGLHWPFRIRRATGPDTTEETTFDRFRINTKIDPKKFEVRK